MIETTYFNGQPVSVRRTPSIISLPAKPSQPQVDGRVRSFSLDSGMPKNRQTEEEHTASWPLSCDFSDSSKIETGASAAPEEVEEEDDVFVERHHNSSLSLSTLNGIPVREVPVHFFEPESFLFPDFNDTDQETECATPVKQMSRSFTSPAYSPVVLSPGHGTECSPTPLDILAEETFCFPREPPPTPPKAAASYKLSEPPAFSRSATGPLQCGDCYGWGEQHDLDCIQNGAAHFVSKFDFDEGRFTTLLKGLRLKGRRKTKSSWRVSDTSPDRSSVSGKTTSKVIRNWLNQKLDL